MSNHNRPLDPFEKSPVGTLMTLKESEETRYEFEIWFDYARKAMADIREGKLVAVRNFTIPEKGSDSEHHHYTILEITSILPIHYAIAEEPKGYPGFEQEARKSAAADWRTQEEQPTEETTKIRCRAIPTNLELIDPPLNNSPLHIEEESNIPMLGEEVKLLTPDAMQFVFNRDVDPQRESVIVAGTLKVNEQVKVYLRVEDFLKTHFGVFGFTGAGKSNLVSTLVAKLLSPCGECNGCKQGQQCRTRQPVKVVLFDLMGEYTGLLIDKLVSLQNAYVVCIGERTLPEPVFDAINKPPEEVHVNEDTARIFLKTTVLPKGLKKRQDLFLRPLQHVLQSGKVKLLEMVVDDVIDRGNPWEGKRRGQTPFQDVTTIVKEVFGKYYRKDVPLTPKLAEQLKIELQNHKKYSKYEREFERVIEILDAAASQNPIYCGITLKHMIALLNDDKAPTLLIINAHDPNELRTFSRRLGERLYEKRRQEGLITPLVTFIFDEADEFIPQDPKGSYADSVAIATTIARRGRKFGLGIGIATQRIIYLDTSIMAQAHTYFVSKLPRKSDRERITEAFGLSEDMFRQTFKFKKGDWLLVSHDAVGMESVPIPIHAENAEDRIAKFLEEFNRAKKPEPEGGGLF